MSNNYIYIIGSTEAQVKEAVQTLANLYSDTTFSLGINIYKHSQDGFIVRFTNTPDFERFKYFVNYLNHPEVESYQAKAFGYWTIGESDGLNIHLNQRAQLYVSDSDIEGDNVYVIFEEVNKVIKLGFAIGEAYKELDEESELRFAEPIIVESELGFVESIIPIEDKSKKNKQGCLMLGSVLFTILIMLLFLNV